MDTFWATEGGWITAALIALIAGVFALWPKKGSLEHQMIDQLQEQVAALEARLRRVEERETVREKFVRTLEKRDQAWSLYYTQVAIGVERGTVPPLPERPEILREIM